MEKAYDFKALLSGCKERGLDLAEDAAVIFVEELSDWVVESAQKSKTPLDDIAAVAMPLIKREILKFVDKIDGKVDAE
jgi:hypothetical protein